MLTKEKGVDIVVLDMPLLDTRQDKNVMETLISNIVLQLLSFVAENEQINIRQRQAEGIAAAKAGVHMGMPEKAVPEDSPRLVNKREEKTISPEEIIEQSDLSETTFYCKLQKYRLFQRHTG